jgi:hypothetical protein
MVSIREKAAHVKSAPQSRTHTCHWPGCTANVPPAMWGCKMHWFRLPYRLRRRIWEAYEPGQENTGRPSEAYVAVARDVQLWIDVYGK